jgi:predicted nuclease of predicted toxin-antitoxin system
VETRRVAFKLDENLSRHLKTELAALGFDALTAADEGLLSRPDAEVAAAAKREHRILLSLDLDLANVVRFPPGSHPGIVLFRPATLGPGEVNRFVVAFVREQNLGDLFGCLVVVEPGRVRVRRPQVI